jgi:flagellin
MAALNANNSLAQASKAQQKGMQKLASGFKINSAADDASGLAISEKMKNQIKALDTAKDNCEDGANLIQTAEGYMGEVHDILTRMTELAEKAANGVLKDEDRDSLQDEMDQLCAEIDRVATTANFNGRKLLDGSLGNSSATLVLHSDSSKPGTELTGVTSNWFEAPTCAITAGLQLQIGESSTQADKLRVQINNFHTDKLLGGIAGFSNRVNDGTDEATTATGAITGNTGSLNRPSTYKQGITIKITDKDNASAAADAIRLVSSYVSDERGKLGAQQNRLDHTINNLTTASENTTAAKSRILDTDMAKEMMAYTSKNVIAQAAQSMLAQANSQPQNVLSLLQ